jgi:hypothetical protein
MVVLVLVLAVAASGCTTVAKEVYYTARGAQGKCLEVEEVGSLARYDSFKVERFSNELGANVPPAIGRLLPEKISEQILQETTLRASGEETLTIRGSIVYVDLQGVGSGAISPMEQVVCHVQLVDDSGDVLGWAAIAGVNKSRARGAAAGEEELCDGMGKGIVLWLTKNGVPEKPED